jgi:hypothetical protein
MSNSGFFPNPYVFSLALPRSAFLPGPGPLGVELPLPRGRSTLLESAPLRLTAWNADDPVVFDLLGIFGGRGMGGVDVGRGEGEPTRARGEEARWGCWEEGAESRDGDERDREGEVVIWRVGRVTGREVETSSRLTGTPREMRCSRRTRLRVQSRGARAGGVVREV